MPTPLRFRMLLVPFLTALVAADPKAKRCDHKELRSADGLLGCTSLDFHFDPLSATELQAVAKVVGDGSIGVFICRGCAIGAAGMEVIGPALLNQDRVGFLTIREDTIGAVGATYLAQLLNQSTKLSGLDLRGAGLGSGGPTLAAALRHPDSALQILNLKVSGLGTAGAVEVAAALRENTELQWLDLSFNTLGDQGAAALAASLAERDESLTLHLEDRSVGRAAGRETSSRPSPPLPHVARTWPPCMEPPRTNRACAG